MSTTEPKRVAVIGGGCSGITSFWALQSSPHDVHLFEASMSPGGRMKSLCFEHGDYQFDIDSQPPSFNAETSRGCCAVLSSGGGN